jgi:Domain of unknown function (DUF4276)
MVEEIRIHVEGDPDLRRGFNEFFKSLRERARSLNIRWDLVASGSRSDTYDRFQKSLEDYPGAFHVLLVDSESAVTSGARIHLRTHDGWDDLGLDEPHWHLMVQTMEAWFIADIGALQEFYKDGFNQNSIPATQNVEEIDKHGLISSLEKATRKTKKGKYHKIEPPASLTAPKSDQSKTQNRRKRKPK